MANSLESPRDGRQGITGIHANDIFCIRGVFGRWRFSCLWMSTVRELPS